MTAREASCALSPRFLGSRPGTGSFARSHYAFGPLHADALFAGHNPEKDRSREALLKLGFVHAHEELYPPTGLKHSSYSLRTK